MSARILSYYGYNEHEPLSYGERFKSLTPTRASELYLYGDQLGGTVSTS